MKNIELNIQPKAGILNVFSRLNYKIWFAIGEFVDNATQSYFDHELELKELQSFTKLIIRINYYEDRNVLTISDNAYGMNFDEFKRAILLDSRHSNQIGRNEFGMGLKTAASWFGNIWKVESTQLNSHKKFSATIDINYLKDSGANSISIIEEDAKFLTHGTTITIEEVTKKITAPKTKAKIKHLLSSMYRRDLANGQIEIYFNDEPLYFDEYKVLNNFRGNTWKKDLEFTFMFDGSTYSVTGFVGILEKGSFPKAGFALLRRNRVVIGGDDENYKPANIFKQAQSQISLKLFGEINLDDFPINQAKDGFIWDDGLEDVFNEALKNNIDDYIEVAILSIKDRESEDSVNPEVSTIVESRVKESLLKINYINEVEDTHYDQLNFQHISTIIENTERNYVINLNSIKSNIVVYWVSIDYSKWIQVSNVDSNNYKVYINIDHPFFKPFSTNIDFKVILDKFAICFVLAENDALRIQSNSSGLSPEFIRKRMNDYLRMIEEE